MRCSAFARLPTCIGLNHTEILALARESWLVRFRANARNQDSSIRYVKHLLATGAIASVPSPSGDEFPNVFT